MNRYSSAGLIYGPHPHHLDHLAVLCIILDIPLIVTEKEIEEQANRYYPQLITFCMKPLDLAEQVVRSYEVVFSSLPKPLIDQIFFVPENLLKKKIVSIWVPHGNSDKGYASYFIEGLSKEKIALVYGQKMVDLFIEKKVYAQLYAAIVLGNYRLAFYREHKAFYDALVQKEIFNQLPESKKTILYAPTWEDAEKSSSLKEVYPYLIENLPNDWNLIIKLHPNQLQKTHEVAQLLHQVEEKKNLFIVREFPLIYPLLNGVDIYLGDMSSIGYDFLSFQRPMFFLNQNKRDIQTDRGLYLCRCGVVIDPEDYDVIFSLMKDEERDFKKIQEEVYSYVFGMEKRKETIKEMITRVYERYLEEKLHLF